VPAAATFEYPSLIELTLMFTLASRKTTLFAPEDAVTPVPPLATGKAVPE